VQDGTKKSKNKKNLTFFSKKSYSFQSQSFIYYPDIQHYMLMVLSYRTLQKLDILFNKKQHFIKQNIGQYQC